MPRNIVFGLADHQRTVPKRQLRLRCFFNPLFLELHARPLDQYPGKISECNGPHEKPHQVSEVPDQAEVNKCIDNERVVDVDTIRYVVVMKYLVGHRWQGVRASHSYAG